MKLSAHCECYADNSYFLFNEKNQITFFKVHSITKVGYFMKKFPVIGNPIVEIISQQYEKTFLALVADCFKGKSLNIEKRLKIKGGNDILVQIVLTPVFSESGEKQVCCTIVDSNRKSNQMKLLDEYSRLASHDLRAPITNILSLSSLINFPDLKSQDTRRVGELLNEINVQAEKLDDIIKMLNRLVNQGQENVDFVTAKSVKDAVHIVLLDDDPITNKLHHMIITKHNKNRKVVPFENSNLALEYLRNHQPDLVLLDLNMPEIDGWKFLDLLNEYHINVDVVIVSSTINAADSNRAYSYPSVKDFLMKPLTYDKIKHLIDD